MGYSPALERPRADARAPWRAWVCLLLGLFFLYNPFVSVATSSGQCPVIQHPLSYRATIASSELGCSTLRHNDIHFSPLEALVGAERLPLQPKDIVRRERAEEPVRVVLRDLGTDLWFRPPPVQ
jgi:hypothetical protein